MARINLLCDTAKRSLLLLLVPQLLAQILPPVKHSQNVYLLLIQNVNNTVAVADDFSNVLRLHLRYDAPGRWKLLQDATRGIEPCYK